MGVSIVAYKGLKKIDCHFDIDGDPIDKDTGELLQHDYVYIYKNNNFPGRADDLEDKSVYSFKDKLRDNNYSYGYYNRLRNTLAKIAGYKIGKYDSSGFGNIRESYCVECWNGKTGPFSELICFSDCEGVIGSDVSKKLHKDFKDFQEKAQAEGDEDFLNFYNSMKSAFEMASDNGAVDFS